METQPKFKYFFTIAILVLLFYSNAYRTPFLVDDFLYLGKMDYKDIISFFKGASPGMDDAPGRKIFYGDSLVKARTYCTIDSDEFSPIAPVGSTKDYFGIPEVQVGITYYRPLQLIFNSLPYQFFGANYNVHHLINIILHILICFLVYNLILELSGDGVKAFLTSLLFAGMPIHTEAVTKIKGLADLLVTILTIYTFYFGVRYIKTRKRRNLYFSFFFYFTGFILKQIIITIPFVIFAYEIIIHDKMKVNPRSLIKKLVKYIPYGLVILILIGKQFLSAGMGFRKSFELSVALSGLRFEFVNLFSPFPLSIFFIILLVPAFFKKNREYLFFLTWTFVMIIPDLFVQEKWNCYIASIGFCASISWLILKLRDHVNKGGERYGRIFYFYDGLLGFSVFFYLVLLLNEFFGADTTFVRRMICFVILGLVGMKYYLYKKKVLHFLFSRRLLLLFQIIFIIFMIYVYGKQCHANNNLLYREGIEGERFAQYLGKNYPNMKPGDEIYLENLPLDKIVWRHASLVYGNKVFMSYPEAYYLQREEVPLKGAGNILFIDYNNGEPKVDDFLKSTLIKQDGFFETHKTVEPILVWRKGEEGNGFEINSRWIDFGSDGLKDHNGQRSLVFETSKLDLISWQMRY
ncbi:glycosyltransferase family 39 protein, partial [bacterium]|nr:glycosyltransferase family 39 protein [bacterium]